jgi:inner membrane transporter RhtA
VLLRLLFAAVVLLAIWRPPLRDHGRRAWWLLAAFGLTMAGFNLSFYSAINLIPLGIAVTLAFVGPLGLAVALSRRPIDGLWVLLAAGGILLLSPGVGDSLDPLGVALALLVGGFWALYILLSARVGRAFAGGNGLALATAIATLALLPAGLAAGGSALLRPEVLAVGAAVAMLSTAIPYSLELEALRRLPPGTFGILVSLQPVVAAAVGFLALDQALGGADLAAIVLIVAASAGAAGTASAPARIEA